MYVYVPAEMSSSGVDGRCHVYVILCSKNISCLVSGSKRMGTAETTSLVSDGWSCDLHFL
jgi:hypothetical protein